MKLWSRVGLSLAVLAICIVNAQDRPVDSAAVLAPATEETPKLSITVSSLYLILPVVKVMAEYRVHPHVGMALFGAKGKILIVTNDGSYKAQQAGAQVRYYWFGRSAHGPHYGLEVAWTEVSGSSSGFPGAQDESWKGLGSAPFIGYKYVASNGFTFESQFGMGIMLLKTDLLNERESHLAPYPVLNLGLGWSF